MKFSSTILAIVFCSIFCFFNACKPDNTAKEEQLLGRWELLKASRNGKEIETLAELFFEFSPEGKMRTNINGAEEETSFTWSGDKLIQQSAAREITYSIADLEPSKMILLTDIQGFSFRFVMEKVIQEE